MTDCASFREMLSELVDGALGPDDAARMRTHLVHCDECRTTLEDYRRIGASIRALPPVMPPADLRDAIYAETIDAGQRRLYLITNRVGYSLAAVAAVVTVFLVAAYLLLGGYQRSIDPEITASRPDNNEQWPITSPIEITFNKPMDHNSVRAALGIQPSGEDQRLSQTWDGNTLKIGMNQPLKPGSTYIVKITDAASDKWGNPLSDTFTLTFETTTNIEAYRTPTAAVTPTPTTPAATRTPVPPTATGLAVAPEQPAIVPALPTATQPAAIQPTQPTRPGPTPTSDVIQSERAPTATPSPMPTSTPVQPTATPTTAPTTTPTAPAPTATLPPTMTPTIAAPTVTPTVATIPVTGAIGDVYWANDSVQQQIGKPLEPSYSTDGRQQDFQHGTMLFRSDTGAVYVLINNQLIWSTRSVSSPADGEPVAGPAAGLWEPGGIFGSVWHSDAGVSTDLGYALSQDSVSFSATVQLFEHGFMFVSPSSVYIFYDSGGWEFWPASAS